MSIEAEAKRIIDNIWREWYGNKRGRITPEGMASLLKTAKKEIIDLAKTSGEESK